MATIKEWEHGDHSVGVTWTHVDYGAAAALTRMGVTGAMWGRGDKHVSIVRPTLWQGNPASMSFFESDRLDAAGVKVWIRYHEDAIPENAFTKATGFAMPLTKV